MVMSLDGRIVVDGWPSAAEQRREYEQVHASYEADGWICGRVTMEPFAGAVRSDAEVARVYRGDAARAAVEKQGYPVAAVAHAA